jgi:hypothetical protein
MLACERVSLFKVVQVAIDLGDSVVVHFGELFFEAASDFMKGFRPKRKAAENQKGRTDGTRQQDSADPGNDQQDSDFSRHGTDPAGKVLMVDLDTAGSRRIRSLICYSDRRRQVQFPLIFSARNDTQRRLSSYTSFIVSKR